MATFVFQLYTSWPGGSVKLRELNGHDQLMVTDTSTPTVLALVNSLIVQHHSTVAGLSSVFNAEKISVSDRDLILAGIYKHNFGNRIESTMRCTSCNEKYDLNFLLDDLVSHARREQLSAEADNEGFYSSGDGSRFRLPNGEDELIALATPAKQSTDVILERCLPYTQIKATSEVLDIMERVGPVLITDLNIHCPECSTAQKVQFDMQSYLLTRIMNERRSLTEEIHAIAGAYGWSYKEILDLPAGERKTYSNLINQI